MTLGRSAQSFSPPLLRVDLAGTRQSVPEFIIDGRIGIHVNKLVDFGLDGTLF